MRKRMYRWIAVDTEGKPVIIDTSTNHIVSGQKRKSVVLDKLLKSWKWFSDHTRLRS